MNIVITTNHLASYAGSEIVALEVAEYFASKKCTVTLITNYYSDPIKSLTSSAHYKNQYPTLTITDDWSVEMEISTIDMLWIQHQVIPPNILKSFAFGSTKKPYVVFHHMSSIHSIELPLLNRTELAIADKIFAVSKPLKDTLVKYGFQKAKIEVFPNLVPAQFMKTKVKKNRSLKKIAIISNHPPKELLTIVPKLRKVNIEVDLYGISHIFERITPQILKRYDLVITIGKTVRYCLVMGIPVYVYDHFGGPGYLNETNFELASLRNFCGKGFNSKSAKEIFQELKKGYTKNVKFTTSNRAKFRKKYDLNSRLRRLIDARPRLKTLDGADAMAAEMICSTIRNMYRHVRTEYENLHSVISEQKHEISQLTKELRRSQVKVDELKRISDSKLWKYSKKIINPIKILLHKEPF